MPRTISPAARLVAAVIVSMGATFGPGCASRRATLPLDPETFEELRAGIEDREVKVVLAPPGPGADSGQRVFRGRAQFDPAAPLGPQILRIGEGEEQVLIPLDQVSVINANHMASGAVWGGLGAALAGVAVGGYYGAQQVSKNRALNALAFGYILAHVTAPIGVVIGGLMGAGPRWRLERPR